MLTPARAVALMVVGTAAMAVSAAMIAGIDSEPLSVAAWRCLLAVPMLAPLAAWELRRAAGAGVRRETLPTRTLIGASAAGVALGVDYSFYNVAIGGIGPGLATVLINIQIVVLPIIALCVDGRRPRPRLALIAPLMLLGVACTAGLAESALALTRDDGAAPDVPLTGVLAGLVAGVGYATYLAVIRRTAPHTTRPAPFAILTVVCFSAGMTCLIAATASGRVTIPGDLSGWAWLLGLAFVGQVVTYLCFNQAMTTLSETVSSTLMLLSAVFALLLGVLLFADVPTAWQLAGCGLIIFGAWWASRP